MFLIFARRVEDVGRNAAELIALGRNNNYASWTRFGQMQKGWHIAHCGQVEEGLNLLHDTIESQRSRDAQIVPPDVV